MSIYGPKQLAESMRVVRENTLAIAEDIPEEKYDFRPTAESRSVRQTLLHIGTMTFFDFHIHRDAKRDSLEGFDFRGFFAGQPINEKVAFSKKEILAVLREEGERWCDWVEKLPEATAAELARARGGTGPVGKSRFEMLIGTKEHEMHHRAQLMVMERLLGVVPHLTRNRQRAQASGEKSAT